MTICLIIDSDEASRRLATEALTRREIEVYLAAGQEGLEVFSTQPIDLVLLELDLPGLSGFDMLPHLVRKERDSSVVVTSSRSALEPALRALRIGADDYLLKPFSAESLLASVDRALARLNADREIGRLSRLLQQRVADLSVLNQISQLIVSSKPMEVWIDEVIRSSCEYVGSEAGSLLILEPEADSLVFYVYTGPRRDEVSAIRLPRGKGIAWWCLEQGRTVRVDHAESDPRFDSSVDELSGFVTRNVIAAPVVVRDERIGVIELVNKIGAGCFSEEDLQRLVELSGHLAVAAQNAIAIRDLKRSREELARWSRELEQTVEQRTQALKRAHTSSRMAREDLERTHRVMKRTQRALIERERMATLGLLAAGVAHEINNPLGFVNANLSVLEEYTRSLRRLAAVVVHAQSRVQAGPSDAVMRLVQEANRVVEDENLREVMDDLSPLFDEMRNGLVRITSIVEKLRMFAEDGRPDGQAERVDLNDETLRLVELVQGSGNRALQVQYELGQLPVIRVPVMNLRQLLLNLFGYFTKQRGEASGLILRTGVHDGRVVLELVDPQVEMSDERLLGLFEPLDHQAGDPQTSGSLGLSAARGLAQAMGGQMWASKLDPCGVCIHVTLPILPTEPDKAVERAS